MFLVKMFYCLVITIIFAVLIVECSGFDKKETISPSPGTVSKVKPSRNPPEFFINVTKHGSGVETSSKSSLLHNGTVVFSRQLSNESVEKIQVTDNGIVTKSTFIPLIPKNATINYSAGSSQSDEELGKIQDSNEPPELLPLRSDLRGLRNNSIVMRNGKSYRIVKIRKNLKQPDLPKNQLRKRSFKLLPNILSLLPVQWQTKSFKNKTEDSKLTTDNVSSIQKAEHSLQSSEKIKKLLNLFTIIKFDGGECYAKSIKGMCLHSSECEAKGWKSVETCAEELGVCCYNEKTCGQQSKENNIYFVNEGFPQPSTTSPQMCSLTVQKADPEVKQLRIDFLNFQLRDPVNGTCLHDRLVVTGQNTNNVVPEICGVNTGQHNVEDLNGPLNLNVITAGEYFPRNFQLKVTQLTGTNELAPKNCLQYHTKPTDIVQMFNYHQEIDENIEEITTGYFNNLNYVICIKKLKGFCSVSYENEEDDSIQPRFQLVNVDIESERLLPPGQAGAETFDCPDDYIIVNGVRLCGEKLNDGSVEIDFTKNHPVTDTSNGPFILLVRTDAAVVGRGFSLKYRQNPCLL